ncbi:uncharacterized protein ARMOST_07676 [Armillaria ostoyae]|uniref:Peptidase S8/S53 domain-containing protein n=1 Tax=Armillaria ostoyae TaxID=47428 RepID=A0A284R6G3_ARMOS|nr:uncharacterized protein ARMOST_07676 [Armillaria ostoyae]
MTNAGSPKTMYHCPMSNMRVRVYQNGDVLEDCRKPRNLRAALGSSDTSALTYRYNYDPSGGAGVDVYVVDTGIYTAHSTFGGRASWGATFGGYTNADGNGHEASGKPSIVSLSLGGSASTTFDNGIIAVINAGIHVVIAAGSNNTNASGTSPARVAAAISVGATTIADARAAFSNYGSVVDIFAPGQYITSSWIGGTSMATPHVSGLVAYLIGLNGNQSPAANQYPHQVSGFVWRFEQHSFRHRELVGQ